MPDVQMDKDGEHFFAMPFVQPSATMLYGIRPAGEGTGDIESLASYILSVAYAHRVSPTLLAAHLSAGHGPISNTRWRSPWQEHPRLVSSQKAWYWIQRLEESTGIRDLEMTTVLPALELFCASDLLKHERYFCIECCRQDLNDGREISYGRLLWALGPVSCCPIHNIPLTSSRACCGQRKGGPASLNVCAFGICSYCGSIGYRCMRSPRKKPDEDALRVASHCRDLVGVMSRLQQAKLSDIKAAVARHARDHDGFEALSRVAGMSKSSMSRWINTPTARFSLRIMADLASAMGCGLVQLIDGASIGGGEAVASKRDRRKVVHHDRAAILFRMREGFARGESNTAVAKALGVDRRTLYKVDSFLSQQLARQSRFFRSRCPLTDGRIEEVSAVLRRLLKRGVTPSLRNAAVESGMVWLPGQRSADMLIMLRRELGDERGKGPALVHYHGPGYRRFIQMQGEALRREFGCALATS